MVYFDYWDVTLFLRRMADAMVKACGTLRHVELFVCTTVHVQGLRLIVTVYVPCYTKIACFSLVRSNFVGHDHGLSVALRLWHTTSDFASRPKASNVVHPEPFSQKLRIPRTVNIAGRVNLK